MLNTLFNTTFIAEWIALLTAIFALTKRSGNWKLFIPFLLVTISTETVGWYLRTIVETDRFRLPFNILLIVRISFFIWFFGSSELLVKYKKQIRIALACFILFALINICFIQKLFAYNYYTEVVGDIMLVVMTASFYYELLMEEKSRKLFSYPYFWLSIGLLLTSLGSIVLYIFMDSIIAYYKETNINIGGNVNTVLNVIFYGNLIIAFLCQRNTRSSQVS
jgi:hypothetical protein